MEGRKFGKLIKAIVSIFISVVMILLYFNFTGIFNTLNNGQSIGALIFMVIALIITFLIINFTDVLFKNMLKAYKVMMEIIAGAYFIVSNIISFLALPKNYYIFLVAQILLLLAFIALTCAVEYFSKLCNEKVKEKNKKVN